MPNRALTRCLAALAAGASLAIVPAAAQATPSQPARQQATVRHAAAPMSRLAAQLHIPQQRLAAAARKLPSPARRALAAGKPLRATWVSDLADHLGLSARAVRRAVQAARTDDPPKRPSVPSAPSPTPSQPPHPTPTPTDPSPPSEPPTQGAPPAKPPAAGNAGPGPAGGSAPAGPATPPVSDPGNPAGPPTPPPTGTDPTPPQNVTRAYSDNSPFNTPVGDQPTVSPQSAAIIANSYLTGGLPSPVSTARDETLAYDHPIYYAKATDPLVTIHAQGGSVNNAKINLPAYARAAGGSDGHMGVVTPDGWEYDLWQVTRSGSTLNVSIGYRQRAAGPGIVTPAMLMADPTLGGGTAPNFGLNAGVITASEVQAGRIPHALFIVVKAGSSDTSFGFGTVAPGANGRGGSGSSVYPAFKGDAAAPGVRAPMGARYWLDMTPAEIDASGAPLWERVIAKAMHEYGGYFGDTGGAGFSFMLESSIPYAAAGATNPWDSFWPAQGVRKDPTWGYNTTFSGKIPWSAKLRVIAPPPAI